MASTIHFFTVDNRTQKLQYSEKQYYYHLQTNSINCRQKRDCMWRKLDSAVAKDSPRGVRGSSMKVKALICGI
jgi:hypothetical protein